MNSTENRARRGVARSVLGVFRRLIRSRRGNIAVITALAIIPLAGLLGMATEASSWFLIHRAAQNAADSAALAAAANGGNGGTDYVSEAKSVAAGFGFTDGANGATITVPAPTSYPGVTPCVSPYQCYRVSIAKTMPVSLLRLVGYNGTSGGSQTITASALATTMPVEAPYCITSLGTGTAYSINGAGGKPDLSGCRIRSNGDINCKGTNASANVDQFVYSGSIPNGSSCAPAKFSSTTFSDPYGSSYGNDSTIKAPITSAVTTACSPTGSATSYPQETKVGGKLVAAAQNTLSASAVTWGTTKVFCGDVQLTADVTVTTASGGTVLVIANGILDLNGHTLNGNNMTVVFTGPNISGFSPSHIPSCSGTLAVGSPSTGSWKGVAIWQDSTLTSGVDLSCSGNQPTWNVTGLVYMPNSNLNFGGAVNKYANIDCFALVDKTFQSGGTVQILERESQCSLIGLTPPEEALSYIGQLVY